MKSLLRPALGAVALCAALLSPLLAQAAPVEFAYELQNSDRPMVFFDMDRKLSMYSRRDKKSISLGDVELIEACDFGQLCLKLFGEDVPVIVPDDGKPLSVPGMKISSEPFEFACCGPCIKTRVLLSSGDRTENIFCPPVGIVSLKVQSKWNNLELVLKSWRGLGGQAD
jgi:hypothetical protein